MTKIQALRALRDSRTAGIVDGVHVDLCSAAAVIELHAHLHEKHRAKLERLPVGKMVSVAFRLNAGGA